VNDEQRATFDRIMAAIEAHQLEYPAPRLSFAEFGRDGNIFAIAGAVKRAYRDAGRAADYTLLTPGIINSGLPYDALLTIFAAMVDFADDDEEDDEWS
jgi:hypothetical protein